MFSGCTNYKRTYVIVTFEVIAFVMICKGVLFYIGVEKFYVISTQILIKFRFKSDDG